MTGEPSGADVLAFVDAHGLELTEWQRTVVQSIYSCPPEEFRRLWTNAFGSMAASAGRFERSLPALLKGFQRLAVVIDEMFDPERERRRLRLRRMRHLYRQRRRKW